MTTGGQLSCHNYNRNNQKRPQDKYRRSILSSSIRPLPIFNNQSPSFSSSCLCTALCCVKSQNYGDDNFSGNDQLEVDRQWYSSQVDQDQERNKNMSVTVTSQSRQTCVGKNDKISKSDCNMYYPCENVHNRQALSEF